MNALLDVLNDLLDAAGAGLILIGAGFLSLPLMFLLQRRKASAEQPVCPPDAQLPKVLVQLAVFNEPEVVTGLLAGIGRLDWPRDKLRVQLLDDSFDGTSDIAAPLVAAMRQNGLDIEHVRRSHREGFKAGALAAGLARSDAPFIAVLDSDFRPPENWLRTIIPYFLGDARVGFVQSRCEFTNAKANWLTRAQGLLFDSHFVMEQNVRARAGLLFQFNGTAGAWRRSAIDQSGGWSDATLTEDLDLTVRAEAAGWHGVFVMEPPVGGLVPERLHHWRVQQRRWASGFMQNIGSLLARIARTDWGLGKKLAAAFLILYQCAFVLVSVLLLAVAAEWALHGHLSVLSHSLLVTVALLIPLICVGMTLPPFLTLKRGGLIQYVLTVITLPPLFLYLSAANSLPMIAALLGSRESFKRTPKPGSADLG